MMRPQPDYPLARNRAMCLHCNHVVESREPGETMRCECEDIAVTGGHVQWVSFYRREWEFQRLGDYELPAYARDPRTHLVQWPNGALSGYTPLEIRALRARPDFPGVLYVMGGPLRIA